MSHKINYENIAAPWHKIACKTVATKPVIKEINFSNKKIIDKIVPVKEWNKDCHPDNIIKVNYGYVMPLFHGYDWKKTKKQLIEKYTY